MADDVVLLKDVDVVVDDDVVIVETPPTKTPAKKQGKLARFGFGLKLSPGKKAQQDCRLAAESDLTVGPSCEGEREGGKTEASSRVSSQGGCASCPATHPNGTQAYQHIGNNQEGLVQGHPQAQEDFFVCGPAVVLQVSCLPAA